MNDYKELIAELDGAVLFETVAERHKKADLYAKAADAIEQLVRERDAAVAEIPKDCGTCKHNFITPTDYSNCDRGITNCNWEWRGVQE